ncbi:hypothetical protein SacmaDRAFT_2994 [Saccharomonospora marina XMU15]|uniref:DUF2267 domain-containing protein n=1 Tax=Saccharomonospora marina XMU15 TaxID=882083 RepID=H5X6K9_9PSEU|nr:DUF2267 domain-containing protein [Saccharomonospora marina]EHR51230.1 hypothetical protein SacmaDRAFT_2994 [Saccharomonospora marina XMU15]
MATAQEPDAAGTTWRPRPSDPVVRAEYTSQHWLAVVGERLGGADRHYSYRVLRAWLHTVRELLGVEDAAHLAGQLPEQLRGTFFEGWDPARVPAHFEPGEFTERFAREADVSADEVPTLAEATTTAVRGLCSPGHIDRLLELLPRRLSETLSGERARERTAPPLESRLRELEAAVETLTGAVSALAKGLERTPVDEPIGDRGTRAAREAHQILLARGRY